jgi:hypothetical protein
VDDGGDDVTLGVLLGGLVVGALVPDDGDEEGSRGARGTAEGVLATPATAAAAWILWMYSTSLCSCLLDYSITCILWLDWQRRCRLALLFPFHRTHSSSKTTLRQRLISHRRGLSPTGDKASDFHHARYSAMQPLFDPVRHSWTWLQHAFLF